MINAINDLAEIKQRTGMDAHGDHLISSSTLAGRTFV